MGRKLKAILLAILVLGVITIARTPFIDSFRTLVSLKRVDDFPLYVLHYYGDYGFADYLEQGLQPASRPGSEGPLYPTGWSCTCFSTPDLEGGRVFGRNFDWQRHPALVLFTDPPGGYASVSTVDTSYLGFDKSTGPISWQKRKNLLRTPYMPFDGMNERGLAVGMMAVPHAEGGKDPNKVTIGSLEAIRLVLDYASSVTQAVELLGKYNIDFRGGPPIHYLLTDSTGDSAIIEFLDGNPVVLRSDKAWQVSTNFLVAEEQPEGAKSSCWRYNTAYQALETAGSHLSNQEAMDLLQQVSQQGDYPTIWSVVYGVSSGEIFYAMDRDYAQVYRFHLNIHP